MTNPFDDPEGTFHVLTNDEGQHSLWPAGIAVPGGWTIAREAGSRADSLAYVEEHWTDIRPRSAAGPVLPISAGPRRQLRPSAALSHRPNTTRYEDDAPPCS